MNKKLFGSLGILLFGILLIGLVAGAGYSVTVPAATTTDDGSSGGGGGGGVVTNTTNATSNETSGTEAGGDEEGAVEKIINNGIENIKEFVKKIDWKAAVAVIVSLAVIGGVVWYFLVDKRKKFIEIRTKKGSGKNSEIKKK